METGTDVEAVEEASCRACSEGFFFFYTQEHLPRDGIAYNGQAHIYQQSRKCPTSLLQVILMGTFSQLRFVLPR